MNYYFCARTQINRSNRRARELALQRTGAYNGINNHRKGGYDGVRTSARDRIKNGTRNFTQDIKNIARGVNSVAKQLIKDIKADFAFLRPFSPGKPSNTFEPNQQKPHTNLSHQRPDTTGNFQRPQVPANHHRPQATANHHRPQATANNHRPQATANNHRPQATANNHRPQATANHHRPQATANHNGAHANTGQPSGFSFNELKGIATQVLNTIPQSGKTESELTAAITDRLKDMGIKGQDANEAIAFAIRSAAENRAHNNHPVTTNTTVQVSKPDSLSFDDIKTIAKQIIEDLPKSINSNEAMKTVVQDKLKEFSIKGPDADEAIDFAIRENEFKRLNNNHVTTAKPTTHASKSGGLPINEIKGIAVQILETIPKKGKSDGQIISSVADKLKEMGIKGPDADEAIAFAMNRAQRKRTNNTPQANPQEGPIQAHRPSAPITQTHNQSSLSNPPARHFLSSLLQKNHLHSADGPKAINAALNKVEQELKTLNADPAYFAELGKVKTQLNKETQQIHREAMLLRLIKTAAKKTNSTSDALNLVKNSPGIKNQPAAAKDLAQLSTRLQSMDINALRTMNRHEQLTSTHPQSRFTSDLVDINTIRRNAIRSSVSNNRIDKENTGLKNTIIVDQGGNLTALKNSVDGRDRTESLILRENLAKKAYDNFDTANHRILDKNRPHMHPQKRGEIKAILGKGSFGKVRPGQDMLTGEDVAIKKMKNIDFARQEVREGRRLAQALKNNPEDMKHFLTADGIAISHGKKGEIKAYVRSKLQGGDGLETVQKMLGLKAENKQADFEKEHGKMILGTMDTLMALNRNNIVHGDLKWDNLIGGKIADIDELCYNQGDKVKYLTPDYVPPEFPHHNWRHDTKESYDTHTSFTFGRMLLESIDLKTLEDSSSFHLPSKSNGRPSQGFTKDSRIPTSDLSGKNYSPYERDVIQLAYRLAAHEPKDRLSMAEARAEMSSIAKKHNLPQVRFS